MDKQLKHLGVFKNISQLSITFERFTIKKALTAVFELFIYFLFALNRNVNRILFKSADQTLWVKNEYPGRTDATKGKSNRF